MAKKLLVKTVQTTDGTTIAYGANKQPIIKETLVPNTPIVRRELNSLNSGLPEHLRHEFEEVEVNAAGKVVTPKEEKPAETEQEEGPKRGRPSNK